jgi:hypothetical protein
MMETKIDIKAIQAVIPNLSLDELLALNHRVCESINHARRRLSETKRWSLRVGDRVQWSSRKNGHCTGTITQIKRVKALVRRDLDHRTWDVPLGMLTAL